MVPPHLRRREARVFDEFTQRKGTQDIHPLRLRSVMGEPTLMSS